MARPVVLPDTFDGDSKLGWDQWCCHFKNVAEVNRWENEESLKWLKVRLTGKAQTAFQRLSEEDREDFDKAMSALQKRFDPPSRKYRYQAELQTRRKLKGESWADFADDIKFLADKAYPELQEEARDRIALNIYLSQLDNPLVAFGVKQRNPESLDVAVSTTLELDSYYATSKSSTFPVLGVEAKKADDEVVGVISATDKICEKIEELKQQLQQLQTIKQGNNDPRNIPSFRSANDRARRNDIICFKCGKEGHIARYCFQNQQRQQPCRGPQCRPSYPKPQLHQSSQQSQIGREGMSNLVIRKTISAICTGGYRVEASVNGVIVQFLVDSGASVTLIRKDVWERVNAFRPPALSPWTGPNLVGVDGSPLAVCGQTKISLTLKERNFETEVLVVNSLTTEAILGLNFLQQSNALIDLAKKQLLFKGHSVSVSLQSPHKTESDALPSVRVVETIRLPPRSEIIVMAETVNAVDGRNYLAETKGGSRPAALVARALVESKQSKVPTKLLNPRDTPTTIKAGTEVATLVPVNFPSSSVIASTVEATTKDIEHELQRLADEQGSHLTGAQKVQFFGLLSRYADIFATSNHDLGRTDKLEHRIFTGDASPRRQRVRRIPPSRRKEVQELLTGMLKNKVIQPSNSPWASPVVLVRKKDGSLRFCVDYRKLNEVTRKDAYPLPRIDDTLNTLAGSQWFTTLDLISGYWQVQVAKSDKEKTAFCTTEGLYEFNVMPFGLCNAPATFQRLMDLVLAGLQWSDCLVYLDDVIIMGRSFEEHLTNLQAVFERLRQAGLKLKPKKCVFFQRKVSYLGHVVSQDGVSADPKKIEKVANWPVPQSSKDVQRFVGFASYYRKFVKDFAEIARPLHKLTERGAAFLWTGDCQRAFEKLRQALITAPVLAFPDYNKPFILDTDASDTGIGAVLSQLDAKGRERVIAYASRTLSKPERQYCVTRRELLAVVYFVRQFKLFLAGQSFTLRTDHGALTWLMNFKDPEGQTARWLESLQQYNFKIVHRQGRLHTNADALSRLPCSQCKRETHFSKETSTVAVVGVSSIQDLRKQQLEDGLIGKVLRAKEKDIKPSERDIKAMSPQARRLFQLWNQLQVSRGCLYRQYIHPLDGHHTLQLVVPASLRDSILRDLHEGVMGGHLGEEKTMNRVKERFYWPGYNKDVVDWVNTCGRCTVRKAPVPKNRAPLQSIKVGAPMQLVAVDILGPLPKTKSGNSYVLTVGDYFTRWMEAYPLPNQEAHTIAKKLIDEFFLRFSPPEQIHSDQGRQFESRIIAEVCELLGIDKTRTSPYHPQSDGLIERFNRTLLGMLAKVVDNNPDDWEDHLKPVCMAYNSSVQPTTGYSPFFLMFGRQVRMPIDVMYGRPCEHLTPQHHVAQLRRRLEKAFSSVRERMGHQLDRQKELYNKKVHGKPYSEGDLVWLCSSVVRKDRGRKLHLPWTGPYKIIRRISEVTYRIQHVSSRKRRLIVHFDRLKPCPPNIRIPPTCTPCVSDLPPSSSIPQEPTRAKFDVTLLPPVDPHFSPPSPRYPRRNRRKTDFYSPVFSLTSESGTYSSQRREQM